MQLLVALVVIAWMVWSAKDPWRRAFPSGLVIGLLMIVFGNDAGGETKTYGVLLAIGCGVLMLIHRIMTK